MFPRHNLCGLNNFSDTPHAARVVRFVNVCDFAHSLYLLALVGWCLVWSLDGLIKGRRLALHAGNGTAKTGHFPALNPSILPRSRPVYAARCDGHRRQKGWSCLKGGRGCGITSPSPTQIIFYFLPAEKVPLELDLSDNLFGLPPVRLRDATVMQRPSFGRGGMRKRLRP